MAVNENDYVEGTNSLRFYLDDNDNVVKCDYLESFDQNRYEEITLPQHELNKLFQEYITNKRIYHEEKIYSDVILHIFFRVDEIKMNKLIEKSQDYYLSTLNRRATKVTPTPRVDSQKELENKFKKLQDVASGGNTPPNIGRQEERIVPPYIAQQGGGQSSRVITREEQDNRIPPKKVTRRNRFNGKKVVATLATITILLGAGYVLYNYNKDTKSNTEAPTLPPIIEVTETPDVENKIIEDNIIEEVTPTPEPTPIPTSEVTPTPEVTETPEESNENEYDQNLILFDAVDNTDFQTYIDCRANYYDLINKYANMYGVDPELCLAIACHERAEHSTIIDGGGALGLFQIQVRGTFNWENKTVSAWNFETNSMDLYTIHSEEIAALENNIRAGVMIIRETLDRNHFDIARGVQEYNYGHTNLLKVLQFYWGTNYNGHGNDLSWLNYRYIIRGGDPEYLEHVFAYITPGTVLKFKLNDGTEVTCFYSNRTPQETQNNRMP